MEYRICRYNRARLFNQQFVQRIDELSKNLDIDIWSKDIHTKKMEFCSSSIEKITCYTSKDFPEDGVADRSLSLILPVLLVRCKNNRRRKKSSTRLLL